MGVGVKSGNKTVPFVNGMKYELTIRKDVSTYKINDDVMDIHCQDHIVKMEPTKDLEKTYYLSKENGKLILSDENGMGIVFKKVKNHE